jgi:hypothetical protein
MKGPLSNVGLSANQQWETDCDRSYLAISDIKKRCQAWYQTPVIPATLEAEIGKIVVLDWLGQKVS